MSVSIRFNTKANRQFFITLNKRVQAYFKETGKSPHADTQMVIKTFVMLATYFVPFGLILTGWLPLWAMLLATVVMGAGMAGIGMSVMHDANHGAYAKNKTLNTIIGYMLNVVGGTRYNWIIQHNVLHHTYTNIPETDGDIAGAGVIKLEVTKPPKKIYRYQHIYAWFLYGLMTFFWVTVKDFKQLVQFSKQGLRAGKHDNVAKEWAILIATKVVYYAVMLGLPMLLLDIALWQWFIGFFVMHFTGGIIMSVVFQLAHVVEHTEQPMPDEEGKMQYNWAVHQLHTTANFARKNRFLNWYVGGLNFQIEHHLFTHICHVHYPKLSEIVKETAEEYGIPYYEFKTMREAVGSHYRMLKQLGAATEVPQRPTKQAA